MLRVALRRMHPNYSAVQNSYHTLRMGGLPRLSANSVEESPEAAARIYIRCMEHLHQGWNAENSHRSGERSDQLRVFVPPEYGFAKPEEPLSAKALQTFKGVLFDYMKRQEPGSAIFISGAVKLGTTTLDGRETVSNETTLIQSGEGETPNTFQKISEPLKYWDREQVALRTGSEFSKVEFSHQIRPISASIAPCSDLLLPQEAGPDLVISPSHGSPIENSELDGYEDGTIIIVNDGAYPKNSGIWQSQKSKAERVSGEGETMVVSGVGSVLSFPPVSLRSNSGR